MIKTGDGGWNPYIAGALTGLLLILAVWVSDKYVGASTTFVRVAGIIESGFLPEHVADIEYFNKEKLIIDWQTLFVAGILIGAFMSAATSKSFKLQGVLETAYRRGPLSLLPEGSSPSSARVLPTADQAVTG
jgi:uncharacterized protein